MYWVATGRTFILAGTEYVLCLAPLRGREPLTFFQIICLAGPFTEPPVASNLQSVASGGLYLINPLRLATASMMVFQRIRLLEIPSTVLIFLGNELDFVQTTQRQRSNSGQVPRAPPPKKSGSSVQISNKNVDEHEDDNDVLSHSNSAELQAIMAPRKTTSKSTDESSGLLSCSRVLAFLGHATHRLSTCMHREQAIPLHKEYATLCSPQGPVTEFLIGEEL